MRTTILSNGALKYDALYPLFCQRVIEEAELQVSVPVSFQVENFVFDFATVLQAKGGGEDGASATSLLNRRNNFSIEELSATIAFARKLLTALKEVEQPDQATTRNHFEKLLLDVLQTEDINDIWNVRRTILPDRDNRTGLRPEDPLDESDAQAEAVEGNRATFVDALWNTVSRYELNGVYRAGLFQTALDNMNASSIDHFRDTEFSWANVGKFISAVNAAYMSGRVGTTPAAFAQTMQDLVDADNYAVAAFAQSLQMLFSVYDGPSVLVPFQEVEAALRDKLNIDPFVTLAPYSAGHSERYVKKIDELKFPLKNGNKFLSFFDMIFRCMAIKAGRGNVAAGELIRQNYSVDELLTYYTQERHKSIDIRIPWPSEYDNTYSADSDFEEKLFADVYFHCLIKRVLFKQMSTTTGRVLGLADEKRYNRDEPYATVINTNAVAIGNTYDAFLDCAQYFMTFLYDDNMYFDRPQHFKKYVTWLKTYLKMFTEVVEPLNSEKFFYTLNEILSEPSLLPVQIPNVMLADSVTNDVSKLIVNPTDFSYFRYLVGTQLSDFKIDLPLKESIDIRFLRQPYCSPMHPYYVLTYRDPNYGPMTEAVDRALRLDKLESILSLGFNKFFLEKGEMIFVQDDLDLIRRTGLSIDFMVTAGVLTKQPDGKITISETYSKYLFKWMSSETRFIIFDLSQAFFFEVADRRDIFGNDVKFVATWPYLVRIEEDSAPTVFEVSAGAATAAMTDNAELIASPVKQVEAIHESTIKKEIAHKSETAPANSETVSAESPEELLNWKEDGAAQ